MTAFIGRRSFITLLGGAAAAWPLAARAAGLRPRIAVLSINSEQWERKNIAAFVDGLRALDYVTSQNVDIDYRYAEGDTTWLKPLAQELIALKPDVALANSPSPAVAVQSVAPSLPIVCPQISDFLVPSLVANYARPGGSVTGMASQVEGVATKLLELALDAVPGVVRIGFLSNPAGASMALWVQQVEAAARARGVAVLIQEARTPAISLPHSAVWPSSSLRPSLYRRTGCSRPTARASFSLHSPRACRRLWPTPKMSRPEGSPVTGSMPARIIAALPPMSTKS